MGVWGWAAEGLRATRRIDVGRLAQDGNMAAGVCRAAEGVWGPDSATKMILLFMPAAGDGRPADSRRKERT